MNSKEGGKMTENEFLLYLNTLTISEEYDDAYFKKLFQALFMFFEPDSISNDIFKRDGELVSKNNDTLGEDDIIFNISSINSHIIIRNSRKKLENKEFTIKFIQAMSIYSNNLGICLATEFIEEKTNEIPTGPKLLSLLNLENMLIILNQNF